ncbi:hypothetical protein FB451DRAFT_1557947 [Mycena latifolia]|nr:hypothetical protein FB451DRAFT_1557947 [Mycena latifolia]
MAHTSPLHFTPAVPLTIPIHRSVTGDQPTDSPPSALRSDELQHVGRPFAPSLSRRALDEDTSTLATRNRVPRPTSAAAAALTYALTHVSAQSLPTHPPPVIPRARQVRSPPTSRCTRRTVYVPPSAPHVPGGVTLKTEPVDVRSVGVGVGTGLADVRYTAYARPTLPGPRLGFPAFPRASRGGGPTGARAGDEAINNDLDDSDTENEADADAETDIVFCTYDKVARVKKKGKAQGHSGGRDYLFNRCTG